MNEAIIKMQIFINYKRLINSKEDAKTDANLNFFTFL